MTTTDTQLSNTEKINICKAAAKRMIGEGYGKSPFDALVNEGYVHITSDDPKKAYWQARMYMFQLVYRGGVGRRLEARKGCINHDIRERRVTEELTLDDLIDIKDAINKLSTEEQKLIEERFVSNMTFEQMAPLHDKKYSTSIKFQVDKILVKLKVMLGR